MDYKLEDIIDISLLQELQDKLNVIYSFPSAIIDNDGKVLTAVAWQDICTKFHRVSKISEKECIKSDKYIKEHLHEANPAVSYQCPHGLIDNATPIIIEGKHLGNFFTGQFFLDKPDLDFFRKQAKIYGFDEEEYLEAVGKVPIWTKDKLSKYLDFIKGFIEIIAGIGLKNLKEIESKNALEITNKKLNEEMTERNRAEEQLKQSHDLLTNLACLVPGVIYQYRLYPDGRSAFPYSSPGMNDIYEVTPDEVREDATPVFGRLHPEDYNYVSNSIQESARTLGTFYCEFRVILPRQGLRWRWSQAQPERTADGGTLWHGIISDITERKEAEEKIKKTQILLKSSIESPKDMIILSIDKQYRYLTFNTFHKNAMLNAYGIDVEIGMNLLDCITNDDDRIKAKINYDKALAGESHITVEEFGDLDRYYYETRYNPILNEKSEIIGATAFSANVTDRKRSEEALKVSEEKFRKAFLTNPDSITITRASDGMLISVNEGFLKITGFSEEEVINKSSLKLDIWVNPQDRQNIVDTLKTGKMVTNYEARFRKKNGNIFYGLMSASIIELNSISCILNITRDITDRKQANENLAKSHERIAIVLDSLDSMVYVADFETYEILFINKYGREIWGDIQGSICWQNIQKDQKGPCSFCTNQRLLSDIGASTGVYVWEFQNLVNGRWYECRDQAIPWTGKSLVRMEIATDITERKKAEEALRFHSEILLNLSEGVYLIRTCDAVIVFTNPQFDRMFGYEPGELIGKNVSIVNAANEKGSEAAASEIINELSRTGRWSGQVQNVRKDRSTFWCRANVSTFDHPQFGKIWISVHQDITERRRAEEALIRSETRFRAIINVSPVPLALNDDQQRITYLNLAFVQTFGYTQEDIPTLADWWPKAYPDPEYRLWVAKTWQANLDDARHTDTAFSPLELTVRCKNGTNKIVLATAASFTKSFEGEHLVVLYDITERKRTEEDLRESENKFHSLFENMSEGVALHEITYDENEKAIDYRILDMNLAYETHTGLQAEKSIGALASEFYGINPPPYLEKYDHVARTGEPFVFETYYEPLNKYFRISVFSPKHGQFATVFEDITNRKHKEEEIQQKNEEMARFTYAVSHDLKSPLVTIKSFVGFLEQDIEKQNGERISKDLNYIKNATDKMSNLLNELLELSRVGRKTNPSVEVSLQSITQEALDLLAGQISKSNVKINITPEPIMLFGDRIRLVEVFQNLIDNSLKFMGEQQNPLIEIGAEKIGEDLTLFVRDNGDGIDQRYQEKIFGLFEKLDVTSGGTGIGLALVKRIVELHGGKIRVYSEGFKKGTTIYFTLAKTKIV